MMNKYQQCIFRKTHYDTELFPFASCAPIGEKCPDNKYGSYDPDTGIFTIKQDEDITKTSYELTLSQTKYPAIASVQTRKGNVFTDVSLSDCVIQKDRKEYTEKVFSIIIDFNKRIDCVIIKFHHNIADNLEITFAYQEADREKYEIKQAELANKALRERAAVKHSPGEALVNIYFQPCSDEYDHTEISLFIPEKTKRERVPGPYGPRDKTTVLTWTMIMRSPIEKGMFFKSITGLAYGTYAYRVKQFDRNGKVILETEHIEFELRAS